MNKSLIVLATAAILIACSSEDGAVGINGTNGENGVVGTNDINGENGVNGTNGENGANGLSDESSASVDDDSSVAHDDTELSSGTNVQGTTCNGVAYNATTHFCAKRGSTEERAYRFVTIASESPAYNKKWMAENLNFPFENSWCGGGSGTTEGDCGTYGRLYAWSTAMNPPDIFGQNAHGSYFLRVCPDGWHVPTPSEWSKLFAAVGGEDVAGAKLKATTLWETADGVITTKEDAYGFAALPAGYYYNGNFINVGYSATFWSYTQSYENSAYMFLDYGFDGAYMAYDTDASNLSGYKNYAFSVRCVQD